MRATSWLVLVMDVLFYPFVIPAVLVGIYLRVLVRRGEQEARDFTTSRGRSKLDDCRATLYSPYGPCAGWPLCCLPGYSPFPVPNSAFLGRTERRRDIVDHLRLDVVAHRPFARLRDVNEVLRSNQPSPRPYPVFTIKLSLYLTNLITDAIIGVIARVSCLLKIPERLLEIIRFDH